MIGQTVFQRSLKLDEVLTQPWESHFVRSEFVYTVPREELGRREVEHWIKSVLPEATKRGTFDLIEQCSRW